MGVQQVELPGHKEARLALLALIERGDARLATIERVDVSCRLLGPERLAEVLRRFEEMRPVAVTELILSFNDIGVAGARRIASSPIAVQLESLELCGNELGDEGIEALLGGTFTRLQSLRLSYNDISDAGARMLAETKSLPRLRELNLRRNRIADAGIRALCSGDFPDRLTSLNLEYNEFQNPGFDMLDQAFDETKTHIW